MRSKRSKTEQLKLGNEKKKKQNQIFYRQVEVILPYDSSNALPSVDENIEDAMK